MKVFPFYLWFVLVFVHAASAIPILATNSVTRFYGNSILSVFPVPPNFDFWKQAQDLGDRLVKCANKSLMEEAVRYSVPPEKIQEFNQGMQDLITNVASLMVNVDDASDSGAVVKKDLSFDFTAFVEDLSAEIDVIFADLMLELKEPPLENQTERYQRREVTVTLALDKIENALVKVYGVGGVPEAEAREKFSHVKPQIKHVVLVMGNVADNHPVLAEIIIFTGVALLATPIAEGLILRPLLRGFGISPLGPVKGSAAAWAQKYFFGAAVKKGSWFSKLQSAGMKWVSPSLGKKIAAGIGAGVVGSLGACFK